MNTQSIFDKLLEILWVYGLKVLAALGLLLLGLWIIKRIVRAFKKFLIARDVDEGLRPFLSSLADTAMKVALVLMVASTVGIETTSFIAVFSAVAFSIGLALQGSLGNFASGVLILLFRPFKVGDLITVSDKTGKVAEIQIFSTILQTASGKKIIIPNGKMTEGPIEKIAELAEVQVEIALLLQSGADLGKASQAAQRAADACPHTLADKPAEVKVAGITRDDMKTLFAIWVQGEHYEDSVNHFYEALRRELSTANIELAKERRKESV